MRYQFDEFELSEEEFSLSRLGKRIAIEPRALSVLFVLAASPGRLLDKKALLEAVWKDTFVEETTLTRTIAVIRKHLEDDPRAPKYIETIPTRGYRFIASVESSKQPGDASIPAAAEPVAVAAAPPIPVIPVEPLPAPANNSSLRWLRKSPWIFGVAAALLLLGVAVFFRYGYHRGPALSTKDTIVLADFVNTTGDPVFEEALRQGMLVQLEQSPVVRLASDGQIRKTLKLMGLHSDIPLKAEVSREVCQRIGGTVVLDGSISMLGNEYVLGLRARRCSTGEEMAAEQIQVAKKEKVLEALTQIATRFRIRIGEASSSVKDLDTPLAEATTSSLDALKTFSEAIRTFNTKGSKAALPLFQRATELDPQFAMAHVWLGRMDADLGDEAASIQSTQRAYALREHTSDRERFSIDVSYDLLVSGNLEKAKASCEAWISMYPRDVYARGFLSALVYPSYGQYEKALEEAQSAIVIDPDFVISYRNAALNLIALNRLNEANQVLQEASRRKLFLPSFVTDAYRIAFLKGDTAGMKQAADAAPANPWLLHYQAATLSLAGETTQAQVVEDQALRLMEHASKPEIKAQLLVADAFTKMLYGYSAEAAKQAGAALQLSSGRNVEYSAALIMAMTGNTDEASKLASDLQRRFAEDTLVSNNYVPTIEAALALNGSQPQRAVELLRETAPFELSQPLYPIYIRGQALLAMGKFPEASAEFGKIVSHPGLVLNDPLLNLAQVHLARAFALAGDKQNARATYDLVLQRWKHADSDLPIFQQVKRERAAI